ncbi:MAG: YtxH domain-containing protein [Archangium sp.]|nr:YtxH domain-containing protein [Archangium sp.]
MTLDADGLLKMINLQLRTAPRDRIFTTAALFFGGAVIGAGVALLMAPKSGAELRKELAENGMGTIRSHFDGHSLDGKRTGDISPTA